MPTWKIHETWAARLGIPKDISDVANHLSDFPEQSQEFMEFCEREGEGIILELVRTHDFKMIMKIPKYLQLVFMREKGSEYLTAWYLHYVLDYIRMAPALTPDEVVTRTADKFGGCHELALIKQFVTENAEEIVADCRA